LAFPVVLSELIGGDSLPAAGSRQEFSQITARRDADPAVTPDIWRIDMATFKP
jgi:hypothetical protein